MSHHYRDGLVTPEFGDLMLKLGAAFCHKIDELTVRVYAKALNDIPLDALRVAFGRAVCEWKGFGPIPRVADLRGYLGPGVEDAALIQWAALNRAASEVGAYVSLDLDDGATAEALVQVFGGWPAFCAAEEGPAFGAKRQEFLAAYRHAVGRRPPPRRLDGLCAAQGATPNAQHLRATWAGRIDARGLVAAQRQLEEIEFDALLEAGLPETGEGEGPANRGATDRDDPGEDGAA
jgi:hypothetical protein